MNDTPQTIKHTLRLPLGVLVDDEWKEIGVVEVPVTVHVNTVHGRNLASMKPVAGAASLDAAETALPLLDALDRAADKTDDRKDALPETLGGAWDRGADFVARHPGMSAEYVRAANPFNSSELAHMREARDNARAEVERLSDRSGTCPACREAKK